MQPLSREGYSRPSSMTAPSLTEPVSVAHVLSWFLDGLDPGEERGIDGHVLFLAHGRRDTQPVSLE